MLSLLISILISLTLSTVNRRRLVVSPLIPKGDAALSLNTNTNTLTVDARTRLETTSDRTALLDRTSSLFDPTAYLTTILTLIDIHVPCSFFVDGNNNLQSRNIILMSGITSIDLFKGIPVRITCQLSDGGSNTIPVVTGSQLIVTNEGTRDVTLIYCDTRQRVFQDANGQCVSCECVAYEIPITNVAGGVIAYPENDKCLPVTPNTIGILGQQLHDQCQCNTYDTNLWTFTTSQTCDCSIIDCVVDTTRAPDTTTIAPDTTTTKVADTTTREPDPQTTQDPTICTFDQNNAFNDLTFTFKDVDVGGTMVKKCEGCFCNPNNAISCEDTDILSTSTSMNPIRSKCFSNHPTCIITPKDTTKCDCNRYQCTDPVTTEPPNPDTTRIDTTKAPCTTTGLTHFKLDSSTNIKKCLACVCDNGAELCYPVTSATVDSLIRGVCQFDNVCTLNMISDVTSSSCTDCSNSVTCTSPQTTTSSPDPQTTTTRLPDTTINTCTYDNTYSDLTFSIKPNSSPEICQACFCNGNNYESCQNSDIMAIDTSSNINPIRKKCFNGKQTCIISILDHTNCNDCGRYQCIDPVITTDAPIITTQQPQCTPPDSTQYSGFEIISNGNICKGCWCTQNNQIKCEYDLDSLTDALEQYCYQNTCGGTIQVADSTKCECSRYVCNKCDTNTTPFKGTTIGGVLKCEMCECDKSSSIYQDICVDVSSDVSSLTTSQIDKIKRKCFSDSFGIPSCDILMLNDANVCGCNRWKCQDSNYCQPTQNFKYSDLELVVNTIQSQSVCQACWCDETNVRMCLLPEKIPEDEIFRLCHVSQGWSTGCEVGISNVNGNVCDCSRYTCVVPQITTQAPEVCTQVTTNTVIWREVYDSTTNTYICRPCKCSSLTSPPECYPWSQLSFQIRQTCSFSSTCELRKKYSPYDTIPTSSQCGCDRYECHEPTTKAEETTSVQHTSVSETTTAKPEPICLRESTIDELEFELTSVVVGGTIEQYCRACFCEKNVDNTLDRVCYNIKDKYLRLRKRCGFGDENYCDIVKINDKCSCDGYRCDERTTTTTEQKTTNTPDNTHGISTTEVKETTTDATTTTTTRDPSNTNVMSTTEVKQTTTTTDATTTTTTKHDTTTTTTQHDTTTTTTTKHDTTTTTTKHDTTTTTTTKTPETTADPCINEPYIWTTLSTTDKLCRICPCVPRSDSGIWHPGYLCFYPRQIGYCGHVRDIVRKICASTNPELTNCQKIAEITVDNNGNTIDCGCGRFKCVDNDSTYNNCNPCEIKYENSFKCHTPEIVTTKCYPECKPVDDSTSTSIVTTKEPITNVPSTVDPNVEDSYKVEICFKIESKYSDDQLRDTLFKTLQELFDQDMCGTGTNTIKPSAWAIAYGDDSTIEESQDIDKVNSLQCSSGTTKPGFCKGGTMYYEGCIKFDYDSSVTGYTANDIIKAINKVANILDEKFNGHLSDQCLTSTDNVCRDCTGVTLLSAKINIVEENCNLYIERGIEKPVENKCIVSVSLSDVNRLTINKFVYFIGFILFFIVLV